MSTEQEMVLLTEGLPTISAKIRVLDTKGFRRSEIARFLKRHPTQVRNVLKADEIKRGRGATVAVSIASSSQTKLVADAAPAQREVMKDTFRLQLDAENRIVLPPAALEALGVKAGSVVIARLQPDAFVLESTRASIRRVQEMVRDLIPDGVSLVDELLRERREEVRREAEGG